MSKPVNVEVVVTDQSQLERAIKKFSRKVKKSGLLKELQDRRYFTKKSVKKRLKRLNKKRVSQQKTKKYKERFEN